MENNNKHNEIHLLDYVNILVNARWTIIKNFFLVVVIAILLSFILPKKYLGTTTLMPPGEFDKFNMGNMFSEMSIPTLGLPLEQSSSAEILVEILKSRSVKIAVLERIFYVKNDSIPLYKYLGASTPARGLKSLTKKSAFFVSKQGMITISTKMNTPGLAADVANAYVEELDKINQEKSVSRAKNSRIYIESQLQETNEKLEQATRELASFQQENRAVSLQEQMQASIQQAGELKGRIIAKEVEIGVMLQTMKAVNPLVTRAQKMLDELKRRYHELQYGDSSIATEDSEFYVPFTDVPQVGLKLAELTRDVKVQETVWQLLNQQYFQTKIEEARNTPTVQILDIAVPPNKHFWPRKSILVIVLGTASIFFTILWVFFLHFYQDLLRDPVENQRLRSIISQFESDRELIKSRITRRKK